MLVVVTVSVGGKGVRSYVSAIHISTVTDFIQQQLQLIHFEF